MKTIGILGGAFNPITRGHMELAQIVLNHIYLDEIWIMPCYDHRMKNNLVHSSHRLEMCRRSCRDFQNIKVSDYEIVNQLDGSVFNLLNKLKEDRSMLNFEFSFIIGTDNLSIFSQWKNFEQLKDMTRFIVVARQGISVSSENWFLNLPHVYIEPEKPIMQVSSTEIREILKKWWKNQLSVSDIQLLNNKIDVSVLKYISQNNLYKE